MQDNILERRNQIMANTYRLFYEDPLVVDRAEGIWVVDDNGNTLLDAYNNVPVVGHSNPGVQKAVAEQLLLHNTHTRYANPLILDYAESLLELFPPDLDSVIFTCTGSEANDLALQIARHSTQRQGVIITENAYHGTTASTRNISPSLVGKLNDPFAETISLPSTNDSREASAQFAAEIREAIKRLENRGVEPAAIILDSSFTSDGIKTEPRSFIAEGINVAKQRGALYIADEVQAGFCRLGNWWGFELHGVQPDLVTLGKPMGNGLPIAGLVGASKIIEDFGETFRYFNTFAGTPVPIAAAKEVLVQLQDMDAPKRTLSMGEYLREQLGNAAAMAGLEVSVYGSGLMVGVDLTPSESSALSASQVSHQIVNELRRRGILISTTGRQSEVLKIRPPLVITEAEIDHLAVQFQKALSSLSFSHIGRIP